LAFAKPNRVCISHARRDLHALIRELRAEGGEITLTQRGDAVATLTVLREPPRFDCPALRKRLQDAHKRDPALAREAEGFHHFMQLLIRYRGVPNWMERIPDPSDPELG